jgi:hypothetical protein
LVKAAREVHRQLRAAGDPARLGWFAGADSDLAADLVFASVAKLARWQHLSVLRQSDFDDVVVDDGRRSSEGCGTGVGNRRRRKVWPRCRRVATLSVAENGARSAAIGQGCAWWAELRHAKSHGNVIFCDCELGWGCCATMDVVLKTDVAQCGQQR